MELSQCGEQWLNGWGEKVDVEAQWEYWLLKSSDLRGLEIEKPRKKVIITQHRLNEDTAHLRQEAPKLWAYLLSNSACLDGRKSSIYRNRSRFAIFGIGGYSFSAYKVAISGLYKKPRFSLVTPIDGQPVMLDDTCYFLGFDGYLEALFTVSLFSSALVRQFIQSVVFTDAKRPYTKEA